MPEALPEDDSFPVFTRLLNPVFDPVVVPVFVDVPVLLPVVFDALVPVFDDVPVVFDVPPVSAFRKFVPVCVALTDCVPVLVFVDPRYGFPEATNDCSPVGPANACAAPNR